jgi:20S proteasome alpha/beta subunit
MIGLPTGGCELYRDDVAERFRLARPHPWERNMTVCIAAACFDANEDECAIILCADWRVSSPLGRQDTKLKFHQIGRGWWCLTAGYDSEINALTRLYDAAFRATLSISEVNIAEVLRTPLRVRKKEKIEEYTGGRFGLSCEEFYATGREKLPQEVYREAVFEISRIQLGTEFIVAGMIDGIPLLAVTGQDGSVSIREGFAVVGDGAPLATASILQRQHMDRMTVGRTAYVVFEAKRAAERVGTVGESTSMAILRKDNFEWVSDKGIKNMIAGVEKYGPRPVGDYDLPPDFFDGDKYPFA